MKPKAKGNKDRMVLASPRSRIAASILDWLVTLGLLTSLSLVLRLTNALDSVWSQTETGLGDLVRSGLGVLLVSGYYFVMNSYYSATIGKFVVGIRIIKESDKTMPLGVHTGFLRSVNYLVIGLVLFLTTLLLFLNDSPSTSGDEELLTLAVYLASRMALLASLLIGLISLIHIFDENKNRQSVMDRFAKTVVIKVNNQPAT